MSTAPARFYIKTMGCQMNEHDSEVITGLLQGLGYQPTEDLEAADLILYNTCSVRENPERKVYGQVGALKALKSKNPALTIGLCGCMPQQRLEREDLLEALPHVDLMFGTHNIHRLPELLERVQQGERVVEVWDEPEAIVEGLPVERRGSLKAFVNIIYGCTNFCSYCVVPYTRGPERSRHPDHIVAEVQDLVANGFREITLLGQNVNAYGKDLAVAIRFPQLLERLDAVPGLWRIRYTTSHPRDMSPALVDAIASLPTVCEHCHLPVQSGSDRILKAMNRGYDRSQYLELVAALRAAVPGISLTTDVIVGFPGETETDFSDTLQLMQEVRFSSAFMFLYSPRKDTPAAAMQQQVAHERKKERIYRLIERQNQISAGVMQQQVERTFSVLVDGVSKKTGELTGRTRENWQVHFDGDQALVGQVVPVRIKRALTWTLRGELVHECSGS